MYIYIYIYNDELFIKIIKNNIIITNICYNAAVLMHLEYVCQCVSNLSVCFYAFVNDDMLSMRLNVFDVKSQKYDILKLSMR